MVRQRDDLHFTRVVIEFVAARRAEDDTLRRRRAVVAVGGTRGTRHVRLATAALNGPVAAHAGVTDLPLSERRPVFTGSGTRGTAAAR